MMNPESGVLIIHNVDVGTVTFFSLEGYGSVRKGIKGEVFAHAYVAARVEFSASLAYKNIPCSGNLSTEEFYSKSFAFTIAAIITTTYTFLMCHCLSI